jgi:hypothetical protein
MQPNLEDIRYWMGEGDRLLAQSWDYLAASEADPIQLELAAQSFDRCARAYLAGAVEYQRGPQAAVHGGAPLEDTTELVQRLDGRLRAEAEAAQESAMRQRPSSQDGPRVAVARAQMLAEELRERFAHAEPELFTRPSNSGFERTDAPTWSR